MITTCTLLHSHKLFVLQIIICWSFLSFFFLDSKIEWTCYIFEFHPTFSVKHNCGTFPPFYQSGSVNPQESLHYLTIIPQARMGYESIAHEAEGRMGY